MDGVRGIPINANVVDKSIDWLELTPPSRTALKKLFGEETSVREIAALSRDFLVEKLRKHSRRPELLANDILAALTVCGLKFEMDLSFLPVQDKEPRDLTRP